MGRIAHIGTTPADGDRVNRSRSLLLIAWGLLAVGAMIQVVRPETDQSASARKAAEPAPESERLAFGTGDADPSLDVGNQPLARPSTDGEVFFDDPARWDRAGVVLPDSSSVATVTGVGVASMFEPETGPVQHWFPNPTQFGGERAFLIVDQSSSEEWVKVSLPVMPNGQEGWIPRSQIEITEIRHRALVDLADDTVTVWDGDSVVVDTRAVTGKPETPTPVGTFYVRDIIARPDPEGPFGPYILALSGFSEVLESFQGGLPALALHGTDTPSQLGSERSAGCIRIPNRLITILAESVPLGTPVTVVA